MSWGWGWGGGRVVLYESSYVLMVLLIVVYDFLVSVWCSVMSGDVLFDAWAEVKLKMPACWCHRELSLYMTITVPCQTPAFLSPFRVPPNIHYAVYWATVSVMCLHFIQTCSPWVLSWPPPTPPPGVLWVVLLLWYGAYGGVIGCARRERWDGHDNTVGPT